MNTFRLVNAAGEYHFVKFHWRPVLGTAAVMWDEAVKISGADPDFHRRDLFEAIEKGHYPEFELGFQIMDQKTADGLDFDVLDATKVIPEEIVPIEMVGKMVLDRNPDNFFAETEQVAFCPSHIVPGIDFSEDPLLQGRLFSYLDTQLSRLGSPNFHELPINRPKCPFANHQRDGHMQMEVPKGRANYEPNSIEPQGPRETLRGSEDGAHPDGRDQGPVAAGIVCGSLFAGAAVLSLGDASGTEAHCQCANVRAEQGGHQRDPQADARPSRHHRREARKQGRRRAGHDRAKRRK